MKITISTRRLILLAFYCSDYKIIDFESLRDLNEELINTKRFNEKTPVNIYTDFSEKNYEEAVKFIDIYGIEEGISVDVWFDEKGAHEIKSSCLVRGKNYNKLKVYNGINGIDFENSFSNLIIIKLVEELLKEDF